MTSSKVYSMLILFLALPQLHLVPHRRDSLHQVNEQ